MTTKPPPPVSANLSLQQMEAAIPKIERRLSDLRTFDANAVNDRSDPSIKSLELSLESTLEAVFPRNSSEFARYRYPVTQIDTATYSTQGTPLHKVREGLVRGVATSIAALESIVRGFREDLADAGVGLTEANRALKAYEGLDLHPEISRAVSDLYRGGHYSNAIEDAVKALNGLVRLRSGVEDVDGTQLMERVFSSKNPVLKFNALADQSDIDEQKGFMMMFSGAVAGLRNPRAHRLMKDDAERALEFIAFISLLAKLVDQAKKIAPFTE